MPEPVQRYHSYLIRCWLSVESESSAASVERLIVETVSDKPQRWGFSTVDDLVAFLRVKLLESEPEPPRPEARPLDE